MSGPFIPTLYAQATAPGRAGVSVVRLSGPQAHDIATQMVDSLPQPRFAALRRLTDPKTGLLIDICLMLLFEKGHSFTGEPVVEFHCHGSLAVMDRLSKVLEALGAQPAQAGAFTRRALENGKMDLAQVEGLADLIDAETEEQRQQAQWVAEGGLSQLIGTWRADLVRAQALCTAAIDFADEDVPVDVTPEVRLLVQKTSDEMRARLSRSYGAEDIRHGFDVALVGLPNSGKSTLINKISGREVALISAQPGTTRDVLEVRLDLKGFPVRFLDLAGLRQSEDEIETMGVERAVARANAAPLRVFIKSEAGTLPDLVVPQDNDLVVQGKADLTGSGVSGATGEGLDALLEDVYQTLARRVSQGERFIRQRHEASVETSLGHQTEALARLGSEDELDLCAEELRLAVVALDHIIGRVDVEDILDVVFSSFCIGK